MWSRLRTLECMVRYGKVRMGRNCDVGWRRPGMLVNNKSCEHRMPFPVTQPNRFHNNECEWYLRRKEGRKRVAMSKQLVRSSGLWCGEKEGSTKWQEEGLRRECTGAEPVVPPTRVRCSLGDGRTQPASHRQSGPERGERRGTEIERDWLGFLLLACGALIDLPSSLRCCAVLRVFAFLPSSPICLPSHLRGCRFMSIHHHERPWRQILHHHQEGRDSWAQGGAPFAVQGLLPGPAPFFSVTNTTFRSARAFWDLICERWPAICPHCFATCWFGKRVALGICLDWTHILTALAPYPWLALISCVLTLSNPFLTFVVFILFYFMKIIVYCGPVFSGSLAGVLRLPIRGCRVFDIIGKLSSVNCNLSVTTRLSFKHYLFAVLTGSQEPRSPLFLNCFDRHMTGKYIGRTVELPRELMEMVYSPG